MTTTAPDPVDDALRLAGVHRRAGRLAEALAVFTHALDRAPGEPRLVRGLAALTAATGEPATAIALYSRTLRDNPDDVEALNNRGVMFLHLGDALAATDCLRRAAALAPEDAAVRGNLGNALLAAQSDVTEALAHLRAAVALAPDDARGPYNLAHALAARGGEGDDAERRTLLERAVQLDPDHVPARVNLANMLLRADESQAALAHYDAALLRDPLSGLVLHNRAHALADQGRWDAALADLQRARGLVVGPHRLDVLIGTWCHRLGRLDAALDALVRAAEARPDLAAPWLALAAILRDQGRLADALAALDQAPPEAGAALRGEITLLQAATRWAPIEGDSTTSDGVSADGLDIREIIRLLRFVVPTAAPTLTISGLPEALQPLVPPHLLAPAGIHHPTSLTALPHRMPAPDASAPYLRSQPDRLRPWPARSRGNAPRLCLAWHHAGNITGSDQDLTLADVLPVLDAVPGAEWVALASPASHDEAAQLAERGIANLATQARDYEDVLAMVEEMDGLIGGDAPLPLLAAAAARPCWLLLPLAPRWPWGMAGRTARDYASVELFRQTQPLSWREPVARVAARLRARFGE
jgi:tetratricopeptide (TPR) repeat protein